MAEKKEKKISKMMQHYNDTKKQYSDCVLFYRLGDFYELFNEDAVEMSKVLDLTLTGKDCGLEERAPMCGIPYHAVDNYINRLINLGYKIAICEQLSTPVPGKIVERDVVRVITPGTVIDDGVLDDKKNNYICCVYEKQGSIAVALCEISTGYFSTSSFSGKESILELNDFLVRTLPSEIIVCLENDIQEQISGIKLNVLPKFVNYNKEKFNLILCDLISRSYFGEEYNKGNQLNEYQILAIGGLLSYLEETQKRSLTHINKFIVESNNQFLQMDLNTRRNLEILETLRDRRKKGALISVIDKTKTTMGSRLLKNWIQEPLYNEKEINNRLNSVEELISKLIVRDDLKQNLSKISDIERIAGRISYGNFTPKDAVSLKNTLEVIPKVVELLKNFTNNKFINYCNNMPDFSNIISLLNDAFVEEPPALLSNGGFIKSEFNKDLSDFRNIKQTSINWVNDLEEKEKDLTGIKSLKIKFNRVSGYYIEIAKAFAIDVPNRYIRKQTVANFDRYITDELKEIEDKILNAQENAIKLENAIFKQIRDVLLNCCADFQLASKIIAELDCLMSFAEVAVKNNYVKPKVSSKFNHILISDGRHPVIEDLSKDSSFIPNDTILDQDENKIMIITGPNMAGKSTYMRQVAIITLLAHIGCFVPAKRAEISLTDRIFTRIGASDDLTIGQSTFMIEMMEVANILENATKKSLVVLDEIGRGTSTFDGLSIAWAVVENIAQEKSCKTMFATHYHEITQLEGIIKGIKNYKIAIKEIDGKLVFLRKIQRGEANRSYGIEVASLAGVSKKVTDRAKEISKELENNDLSAHVINNTATLEQKEDYEAKNNMGLSIVTYLKDININNMTPLNAFDILSELIQKVQK